MKRMMLLWWLTVCVQILLLALAGYNGFLNYVIDNDITYLSELIFVTWAITTVVMGFKLKQYDLNFEKQWFFSEVCMTLGMIGTVIGFLLMLGGSFAKLDPSNVAMMKEAIAEMAVGLSVALITTLCGLIASLFIKLQIIIVEKHG